MRDEIKYLVRVSGDTASMVVVGKASYLNCRSAGDFFAAVSEKGCGKIVVDCLGCTGMDSTFLGMIAGAAIRLRKTNGKLTLLNLNERNSELIENLGLGKLVEIVDTSAPSEPEDAQTLPSSNATTSGILHAHESLIEADSANKAKFEDVIAFLKKETKE